MSERLASRSAAGGIIEIVDAGPSLTDIKTLNKGSPPTVPSRPHDRLLDFNFEYLGFLFAAKAQREQSGNDKLQFRANLGRMPFSAESRHDRANALAIVATASKVLDGRVRISDQQRIMMAHEESCDCRLTPISLMTRVVDVLLRAKPFLHLLAAAVDLPTVARGTFRKAKSTGLGRINAPRR